MKSRNRELNIFSMSALDLFASAMGAFILIAFVLFPYFPNTGDAEEIAKLIQERDKLMGEKDKLIGEKDKLAGGGGKAVQKDSTSVLLGIKTIAKKFVIVVDMSGSIDFLIQLTEQNVGYLVGAKLG